jgi:signal transduction histidine kinase
MGTSRSRKVWLQIGWLMLFGGVWQLGARLAQSPGAGPTLWFAIGVFWGFLVMSAPRTWLWLAAAALLSDVARHDAFDGLHLIGWLADTLALSVAGLTLLRIVKVEDERAEGEERPMRWWFAVLLLGGVLAPAVSATVFDATSHLVDLSERYPSSWLFHFSGCSLGVLTVTPFVIAAHDACRRGRGGMTRESLAKDAVVLALMIAVMVLALNPHALPPALRTPLLVDPILLWVALQGRLGLTAAANLVLAVGTIVGANVDHIPFAGADLTPFAQASSLQLFIGLATLTHLALTLVSRERRRAMAALVAQGAALSAANAAAVAASGAKSRFLANMSHEIRSPLAAMLGFAELLQGETPTAAERHEYAEIIKRNGRHLGELIDQILDLSKVEAGRLELEERRVDVQEVVDDTVATVALKAREKSLALSAHLELGPARYVLSDPLRLRQILLNALANAVKFTDRGSVRLTGSAAALEGGRWRLDLRVHDTGIGIDAETARALFRPFSQADASMARRFGGTGLGLALSKHLAQHLGGDFVLERSALGAGSVFRLWLDVRLAAPAAVADARDRRVAPATLADPNVGARLRLAGRRILVADDAPDNRTLISRFLTLAGAEVDCVENGRRAVERALAMPYDLVLMDVQMPEMDGFEAMSCLRAQGYARPVVALTAHAMAADVASCLDAGFSDHLGKPVSRDALVTRVASLTAGDGAL